MSKNEVTVFKDDLGRQFVRSRTCQFSLWHYPKHDVPWAIDASQLRSGKALGWGYRAELDEIFAGRAMYAEWPPVLFRFVRAHIAEAMLREGFSAHEATEVVKHMKDSEAEVVAYSKKLARLRKLTWTKLQ
ncbi:hypothetical protein [Limimaricola litoreus]|uniref:Uncharacterized protein n=1 Tax=Limimaricola litoreus TaxID=2955316 RepID=A0A9X2FRV3_9RHOB|nr:hypothetical protein [Limimaricola litoreus]MCP1168909.1 hypothetical protein [Limimaricola litoreus]